MAKCKLRITREDYESLYHHLYQEDGDEHGAVLLAGLSYLNQLPLLTVREVHLAKDGVDYVAGKIGHRALVPQFIHRLITRARDERLVFLAVHNHGSDRDVGFSNIDIRSHERGYPALLQIAKGMPVGALVLGRRAMQADLWMPDGSRCELDQATVIGMKIDRLTPQPVKDLASTDDQYDRQIRMFGLAGQRALARAHVAVIGLGGIGSLVVEYLARLGVGHFTLIDDDVVEASNLSRIVGASLSDAENQTPKGEVAERLILQANPLAHIERLDADVTKASVAAQLKGCDYIFLAADSMRARLLVNALVHQHLIPAVQLGSKIRADEKGRVLDTFSAIRPLRPGAGCLWCNQLIDPSLLAKEAKTDAERKEQAYGVEEPNPSVISLNAVAAAHGVNDFLMDYLGLRDDRTLYYQHVHGQSGKLQLVEPRRDAECSECSKDGMRFARGDGVDLPCTEG
ncbi:MAG: ThiF family adenylyltransferase [Magnetospirillum sp.]|nr:ThiF family adenylyltransferase [Magnetospirillum sp.]